MLKITDIVLHAELRAALGVSDDELPEDVLSLEMYRLNLNAEIQAVSSDLEAAYVVVSKIEEKDRSAKEQTLFMATALFGLYAVALHLTESLPIFSPKTISDGKATFSRYSDSPYKETIASIKARYAARKEALIEALAEYEGTTATAVELPAYLGVSSPDTDPVTGS